jgi:D-aminoacyl-tRNA deacylase
MSNKGITLSLSDPAGQTMLPIFRDNGFTETQEQVILKKGNKYLFIMKPLIVPEDRYKTPKEPNPYPTDYDELAKKYDLEYIVVASRHWAESGKPSLTVHPTGNFGKAMYGGRNYELQMTAPNPMRDIYLRLDANPPENYQVSLEATHHSPTQFKVPMFFVEVGSRKEQWKNEEVCSYLVDSILEGMDDNGETEILLGFGGGHYCPTFSSKMKEFAFGHIAAKYSIPLLTNSLVDQMRIKSQGASSSMLDKGLKSGEKRKVQSLLYNMGISII